VEQDIAVAAAQRDYTVWGLIMQADPVVKGVMLLLVLASVACWAIIFEKLVRIAWLKGAIRRLEKSQGGKARDALARRVIEGARCRS
jgi:hypothetical protein